jgi:hypothetical protein
MPEDGVATVLWWLGLVAAPAVLIGIELFHPAHFTGDPGMFQFLSKPEPYYPRYAALSYPGPGWWLARKAPWPPLVLLLAFGWQLQISHASPHGPLAFSLLIVAALWIWRSARQTARPDTDQRPFDHLPPIRESHG